MLKTLKEKFISFAIAMYNAYFPDIENHYIQDDTEAMKKDWEMVGLDMYSAINEFKLKK